MKLIIIRGIPGTGKTLVTNILGQLLPNSQVIHVDEFKLKAMEKGKSFKEAQEISYTQAMNELDLLQDKHYIILEEIICDRDFLRKLHKFCYENKIKTYWFRLLRPLNKLLEIESNRNRAVKNTQEDLAELKKDIESLKIHNECLIKNHNLAITIKKILDIIL